MGWLIADKQIAIYPCRFCGKEIGDENKYYTETYYDDDGRLTGRCYSHFVCTHIEAAKLRQA
jgi:hypothetical protein